MCLQHLQGTLRGTNDWIVTLTDGDDNCSAHITAATVKSKLRSARVGLVIIGIGDDVKAEVWWPCMDEYYPVVIFVVLWFQVLKGIADSAAENKGTYLFARGDKKSIDEAFGEVAAILSGGTFITEELWCFNIVKQNTVNVYHLFGLSFSWTLYFVGKCEVECIRHFSPE